MSRVGIVAELFEFLKARRKLWLSPLILFLILIGILIVFSESSALAPFIYALF